MNKQELAAYLEAQKERFVNVYGGEIVVHAAKAPVEHQRKQLAKKCETRKKPAHLKQEEWEQYLTEVANGTYKPQEYEVDLYDYTGL